MIQQGIVSLFFVVLRTELIASRLNFEGSIFGGKNRLWPYVRVLLSILKLAANFNTWSNHLRNAIFTLVVYMDSDSFNLGLNFGANSRREDGARERKNEDSTLK